MAMCEWNPDLNRPALTSDVHPYLHNAQKAIRIDNEWYRLCRRCLQLPKFKKFDEQSAVELEGY